MKEVDTLIASIFYLMTRHSQSPKAGLEQAIVDHMQMLASHPNCNSKVLTDASHRLSMSWRQEARLKELGIERQPVEYRRERPTKVH